VPAARVGLAAEVRGGLSASTRTPKGKPLLICGDGKTIHQFLHVDDAALCFCNVLGKKHTIGQVYNMTNRGFWMWVQWHGAGMKVIGREVDLIGVPFEDLRTMNVPSF